MSAVTVKGQVPETIKPETKEQLEFIKIALTEAKKPLQISEIRKRTKIAKSTLSYMLRILESEKEIVRIVPYPDIDVEDPLNRPTTKWCLPGYLPVRKPYQPEPCVRTGEVLPDIERALVPYNEVDPGLLAEQFGLSVYRTERILEWMDWRKRERKKKNQKRKKNVIWVNKDNPWYSHHKERIEKKRKQRKSKKPGSPPKQDLQKTDVIQYLNANGMQNFRDMVKGLKTTRQTLRPLLRDMLQKEEIMEMTTTAGSMFIVGP
jgi:hypothetical protein